MESQKDYAKGYSAGRKRAEKDLETARHNVERERKDLRALSNALVQERHNHLMAATLGQVLANCDGWSFGDKPIKDAAGYVNLTKIFVDHIIKTRPV